MSDLGDNALRRYARNLSLPQVGQEGQERLMQSSVLVIGAGGLGCAAIPYLAAAGIGHIGIADHDRVELSNLNRQTIYEMADIGRSKAQAARDRVQELNPDTRVTLHEERVDAGNADALVQGYDIVVDGSDNFATRFVVNAACFRQRKPLVTAALRAWEGQLAVFRAYEKDQPCYRCFVGASPDDERGCRDAGVMGAFAGVMGSLQALEAIKEILGIGTLTGRLMKVNGLNFVTKTSLVKRDPLCQCCTA